MDKKQEFINKIKEILDQGKRIPWKSFELWQYEVFYESFISPKWEKYGGDPKKAPTIVW